MTRLIFFIFFYLSCIVELASQCGQKQQVQDECYSICATNESCMCKCIYDKAYKALREDSVYKAVNYLTRLLEGCDKYSAGRIIDSIRQNYRSWRGNGSLYALTTFDGQEITPFEFSNPSVFVYGFATVEENGRYYLVNKNGKKINSSEAYRGIFRLQGSAYCLLPFTNGERRDDILVPVKNPQKIVFGPFIAEEFQKPEDMSAFMDMVSIGTYDTIYWPQKGVVLALKNSTIDVLDISGRKKNPKPYTIVGSLFENRRWYKQDGLYGFLDEKGMPVIPARFDSVLNFNEGVVGIRQQDKTWMLVDKEGNPVSSNTINQIGYLINGIAIAQKGKLWGIINKKGEYIVKPKYEGRPPFDYYSTLGYIDGVPQISIPIGRGEFSNRSLLQWQDRVREVDYDQVYEFRNNRALALKFDLINSKYSFLDTSGKVVFDRTFEEANSFSEGKAAVFENGEWKYIDIHGKKCVNIDWQMNPSFEFSKLYPFFNGKAVVQGRNGYGIIDTTGKYIIPQFSFNLPKFDGKFVWMLIRTTSDTTHRWALYDLEKRRKLTKPIYVDVNDFIENFCWCLRDGKWCYVDTLGHEVIAPTYQKVLSHNYWKGHFRAGVALVEKDNQKNFIDTEGHSTLSKIFNYTNSFHNFSIKTAFVRDTSGKTGFIDGFGKWIIDPQYNYVSDVVSNEDIDLGLIRVTSNNLTGLVNSDGVEIVKPIYDFIGIFRNGIAAISLNKKYGYIKLDGNPLVPPKYLNCTEFSEGFAWVCDDTGKWGIIESFEGKLVSKWYEYEQVGPFNNGISVVRVDGNWRLVNTKGEIIESINSLDYSFIDNFRDGYALVIKNGLKGYIDTKGELRIPCKYTEAVPFKNGRAGVSYGNDQYQYINKEGLPITTSTFFKPYDFNKGYCITKLHGQWGDGGWGIIDTLGKVKFNFIYDQCEFIGDYLVLTAGSKWALYDCNFNPINTEVFNQKIQLGKNILLVYSAGKLGVLYLNEHRIIPTRYEDIAQIDDEFVMVKKNGKWGWCNHEGVEVIPCIYDAATPFKDQKSIVSLYDMQLTINTKGEVLFFKQ
jgi:hypothetical protein